VVQGLRDIVGDEEFREIANVLITEDEELADLLYPGQGIPIRYQQFLLSNLLYNLYYLHWYNYEWDMTAQDRILGNWAPSKLNYSIYRTPLH
jgi:hypothetical protein